MRTKKVTGIRKVTLLLPVTTYRQLMSIKEESDLAGKGTTLRQMIVDAIAMYCEKEKQ